MTICLFLSSSLILIEDKWKHMLAAALGKDCDEEQGQVKRNDSERTLWLLPTL